MKPDDSLTSMFVGVEAFNQCSGRFLGCMGHGLPWVQNDEICRLEQLKSASVTGVWTTPQSWPQSILTYEVPRFSGKKNCLWECKMFSSILWFPCGVMTIQSVWELNPCTSVNVLDHACVNFHYRKDEHPWARIVWPWKCAVPLFLSRHYRFINLEILCIPCMDIVGLLCSFGYLQAKTDQGEQLQRAVAVFPIRTSGKAAAVPFLGSQIVFRIGPGTWKSWSFMMGGRDEGFVVEEKRWWRIMNGWQSMTYNG